MTKGRMFAFTNAVSPEQEDAFNAWYDGVHGEELKALPGVAGMTRYRAVAQFSPQQDRPQHKYVAVFDLDDVQQAMAAFGQAAKTMTMSDAADLQNAFVVVYEAMS